MQFLNLTFYGVSQKRLAPEMTGAKLKYSRVVESMSLTGQSFPHFKFNNNIKKYRCRVSCQIRQSVKRLEFCNFSYCFKEYSGKIGF